MQRINKKAPNITRDQRGTSSIEYALIATAISIAALATMSSLATSMKTSYSDTASSMAAASVTR